MIGKIWRCLPDCVYEVVIQVDGEFLNWETVNECVQAGIDFTFVNKLSNPSFDREGWYQQKKRQPYQYNSRVYQPQGWKQPRRFVAMRIPKEAKVSTFQGIQLSCLKMTDTNIGPFVPVCNAKPKR